MQDRWRASITELMLVSRTTRWCRDHEATGEAKFTAIHVDDVIIVNWNYVIIIIFELHHCLALRKVHEVFSTRQNRKRSAK